MPLTIGVVTVVLKLSLSSLSAGVSLMTVRMQHDGRGLGDATPAGRHRRCPLVLLGGLCGNVSGRRWFVAAPLLFAGVLLSRPADMMGIFDNGVGGGAIAIPLIGMAGGYVLARRGPSWGRLACGLVALVPYPVWALTATAVGGSEMALSTPRGAWVAVYLYAFVLLLQAACAIPHLPAYMKAQT